MSKVTGSFVFRNAGDGCLTCKYLNDGTPSPLTAATREILRLEYNVAPGPYLTFNARLLRDIYNETYLREE